MTTQYSNPTKNLHELIVQQVAFWQENCIEEVNPISKEWLGKRFSNFGQLARKKQETGTLLYQGSCRTSVLLLWISEGFFAFECSWRLLATGTPVHRLKALTSSLCSWFPCLDWAIAAHCQPESFHNLHGNFKIRIQNNSWSQYGQQLRFETSVWVYTPHSFWNSRNKKMPSNYKTCTSGYSCSIHIVFKSCPDSRSSLPEILLKLD